MRHGRALLAAAMGRRFRRHVEVHPRCRTEPGLNIAVKGKADLSAEDEGMVIRGCRARKDAGMDS
jgi:hypothetical protein